MKKFVIGICLIFMTFVSIAYDGQLDNSFGNGGIVTTSINFNVLSSAVIQSDGKIIVGGYSYNSAQTVSNFTLARYNTNGSLDSSFGNGGIVITVLGGNNNQINSIALQTDGKIVVGGQGSVSSSFVLARYNSNGSLDTAFGNAGIVITTADEASQIVSIALQVDGKIVVAGSPSSGVGFVVARYYPNGARDDGSQGGTGFGTAGLITLNVTSTDIPKAIAVQEDGKIVLGGMGTISGSNCIILIRLNTNGSLDVDFGDSGSVVTVLNDSGMNNFRIQSDGKIVVAGFAILANASFSLTRYNSDGSLDEGFGTEGQVITPFSGESSINDVVIQADGKLIGGGVVTVSGLLYFGLARYNPDGLLDVTFNPSGLGSMPGTVITPASAPLGNSRIYALALEQSGKIVAGGISFPSDDSMAEFITARYLNNNPLVATTITAPINNVLFSSTVLTVSGTAQNPSNIGVFADGVLVGTTVTSGNTNSWTLITTVPLASGSHVITAVAEYKDGNVTISSTNSVTITVNTCRSALSLAIAAKYCPGTLV